MNAPYKTAKTNKSSQPTQNKFFISPLQNDLQCFVDVVPNIRKMKIHKKMLVGLSTTSQLYMEISQLLHGLS